jgi:hypothetical protein
MAGAEQAEAVLRQRLHGQFQELRVLVRAEGVILQGRVVSYYAKQLAQHAAHKLMGLPIAANEIEVRVEVTPPLEASDDHR